VNDATRLSLTTRTFRGILFHDFVNGFVHVLFTSSALKWSHSLKYLYPWVCLDVRPLEYLFVDVVGLDHHVSLSLSEHASLMDALF